MQENNILFSYLSLKTCVTLGKSLLFLDSPFLFEWKEFTPDPLWNSVSPPNSIILWHARSICEAKEASRDPNKKVLNSVSFLEDFLKSSCTTWSLWKTKTLASHSVVKFIYSFTATNTSLPQLNLQSSAQTWLDPAKLEAWVITAPELCSAQVDWLPGLVWCWLCPGWVIANGTDRQLTSFTGEKSDLL